SKIVATPKANLLAGSLGGVFQFGNITDMYSSPQPATNFDAVGANGRAFFVSSSPFTYGDVHYKTLTWSGGTPSLSATTVITTAAYDAPLPAPASGSTSYDIDTGDDRLLMAMVRNGHLWTTREVGTDDTG